MSLPKRVAGINHQLGTTFVEIRFLVEIQLLQTLDVALAYTDFFIKVVFYAAVSPISIIGRRYSIDNK